MRGRVALAAIVLAGVGIAACGAGAFAQTLSSYDGTGSHYRPKPGDKPDSEKDEKAKREHKADDARRRQDLQHDIDQGDARAMAEMAAILEQGDEVDGRPDRTAAFDLYEKAAARKNRVGLEKMCVAYLLGEGRPVDYQKGLDNCYSLNDQDPVYVFASAFDYEHGLTGPKNASGALSLYVQAGKGGSGEAKDIVGQRALTEGKPDVARSWFRQGVYLGSADAMDHLAAMTEAGQGGTIDQNEAYWLYFNAARRGNVHAAKWMEVAPSSILPPDRMTLRGGNGEVEIVDSYVDKSGKPQTQAINIADLGRMVQGYFPPRADADKVEGQATLYCYVDSGHKIDACVVSREYPPGYGFGLALEQLFNGHLTLAPVDGEGQPTANKVFGVTFDWEIH